MSRNPFILRQGEVARVMDACDKLAALRAENARLHEALKEIQEYASRNPSHGWSCGQIARAALNPNPNPKET